MRLCPSVEGSGSPLITHRIGAEVCLGRQDANFHKCHRCIYRGKSADWTPPPSADPLPAIELLPSAVALEHAEPVTKPRVKPSKPTRKPLGGDTETGGEAKTVAAMAAVKRDRKPVGKTAAIDATM